MSGSVLKTGGWRLAHAAARYRRDPGRAFAGARHRSRNECRPAVSTWREWTRIGTTPVGPFGPPPTVPVEMPSHSADTRARPGTPTTTLITTSRPARTFRRGRFLEGDGGRLSVVTVNVTLNGTAAGHSVAAPATRPADAVEMLDCLAAGGTAADRGAPGEAAAGPASPVRERARAVRAAPGKGARMATPAPARAAGASGAEPRGGPRGRAAGARRAPGQRADDALAPARPRARADLRAHAGRGRQQRRVPRGLPHPQPAARSLRRGRAVDGLRAHLRRDAAQPVARRRLRAREPRHVDAHDLPRPARALSPWSSPSPSCTSSRPASRPRRPRSARRSCASCCRSCRRSRSPSSPWARSTPRSATRRPRSRSSMFNIVAILGGVAVYFVGPSARVAVIAGPRSRVVGGLAQLAIQIPPLFARLPPAPAARSALRDPGTRRIAALMAPATLGVAAVQINVVINSSFASLVSDGAISWLSATRSASCSCPSASSASPWARRRSRTCRATPRGATGPRSRGTLRRGLRMVLFLTVPSMVGLALLGVPIIRLIYEHGRFSAHATHETARALAGYAVGLAAYAAVKVVAPAFYALGRTRVPLVGSVIAVVANLLWNFAHVPSLRPRRPGARHVDRRDDELPRARARRSRGRSGACSRASCSFRRVKHLRRVGVMGAVVLVRQRRVSSSSRRRQRCRCLKAFVPVTRRRHRLFRRRPRAWASTRRRRFVAPPRPRRSAATLARAACGRAGRGSTAWASRSGSSRRGWCRRRRRPRPARRTC